MEIKKIKNTGGNLLGAFAIIQIILLINAIPAESRSISESNLPMANFAFKNGKKNFLDSGFNVLVSLLAIRQIGSVSATEELPNCCVETNDGGFCQGVESGTSLCESPTATKCSLTSQCKEGTCVTDAGIACSVSPQVACEGTGTEWFEETPVEIAECQKGCCIAGSGAHFETNAQCELESGEFQADINTEAACIVLSQNLLQGACVTSGGACTFTTGNDCNANGGTFFANQLCTNPLLEEQMEVDCSPTEKTMIVNEKIYWTDSCGNPANIYDASKVFDGDFENIDDSADSDYYWATVSAPNCAVNADTADSLKGCGACDKYSPTGGTLAISKDESEIKPTYGDYICKDLRCKVGANINGPLYRKNGESWCVFEGSIGNRTNSEEIWGIFSSDTVGSEHWLGKCVNGELEWEHSDYRDYICQEQTTCDDTNQDGVCGGGEPSATTASLVPNQAPACFMYNPLLNDKGDDIQDSINNCNANSHCIVKEIDVDKAFKFKVCAPKYPTGFDDETLAQTYCAMANVECPVIFQKSCSGGLNLKCEWVKKINGDCEKPEFAQQMNNLCVSLGDCGSYVNYVGKGTNNVQLSGENSAQKKTVAPAVFGWQNYIDFADDSKWPKQIVLPNEAEGEDEIPEDSPSAPNLDTTSLEQYTDENTAQFIVSLNKILNPNTEVGGHSNPSLTNANLLNIAGLGGGIMKYLGTTTLAEKTIEVDGIVGVGGEGAVSQTTIPNWLATVAPYFYVAMWAAVGAFAGAYLAKEFGITGDAAEALVLAGALAGGATAYYVIIAKTVAETAWSGWTIFAAAVIIAIIISLQIGKTKELKVKFSCLPWQAPTGGEDCSKCSDGVLLCTKYRCESLGQACQILNEDTDKPVCESITPENIAPRITAGTAKEGYTIVNLTEGQSAKLTADNGGDGCIKSGETVDFTLNTDEFAQCKWDYSNNIFEDMQIPLSGNSYNKNHLFSVTGLSLDMLDAFEITGDVVSGLHGEVEMKVKCQDFHGNMNPNPFVVNFCLAQGPDATPVLLDDSVITTPDNGATLPYGTTEVEFSMLINEPANCKYDSASKDYELMAHELDCNEGAMPDQLGRWKCKTPNLDIDDTPTDAGDNNLNLISGENTFYIRCKDQPWISNDGYGGNLTEEDRNMNIEDYVYTLKVTETPLLVNSISLFYRSATISLPSDSPKEIFGGGADFTVDLLAETSGGNENGKAHCGYDFIASPSGYSGDFFFQTDSTTHMQNGLGLQSGNYNISITCEDNAENVAENSGLFDLSVDSSPPNVVRAYHDGGKLKLVTDEDAKCAYGTERNYCSQGSVENGTAMTIGFSKEHSTSWNGGQTYYIKCKDVYDKESNGCARIIIPTLDINF